MDSMRHCTPPTALISQSGSAFARKRSRPECIEPRIHQSDVPSVCSTVVAMMSSSIAQFGNSYHLQAASSMSPLGRARISDNREQTSYLENMASGHSHFGDDSRRSGLSAPTLHYHTLHAAQAVHTGPAPTPCHVGFPNTTGGASCEATYTRYSDSQFPLFPL